MRSKFKLWQRVIATLLLGITVATYMPPINVNAKLTENNSPGSPTQNTQPGTCNIIPGIGYRVVELDGAACLEDALANQVGGPFQDARFGMEFAENPENWYNGEILAFHNEGETGWWSCQGGLVYSAGGTAAEDSRTFTFRGTPLLAMKNETDFQDTVRERHFNMATNTAQNVYRWLFTCGGKGGKPITNEDDIDVSDLGYALDENTKAGNLSDQDLYYCASSFIYGRYHLNGEFNSYISDCASNLGCSVDIIELILYSLTVKYWCSHEGGVKPADGDAMWEKFCTGLNQDGSTNYYAIIGYEYYIMSTDCDSNGLTRRCAVTLGGIANTCNLDITYIVKPLSEYNNAYYNLLTDHTKAWCNGPLGDIFWRFRPKACTFGRLMGCAVAPLSTKIPSVGEGKINNVASNLMSPLGCAGSYMRGDHTWTPEKFRGFILVSSKWNKPATGLEIKVEPKKFPAALGTGAVLDVKGEVKVKSPAVEAIIKETSAVSLVININMCAGESAGIAGEARPIESECEFGNGSTTITMNLTPEAAIKLASGSSKINFTHQLISTTSAIPVNEANQFYNASATWTVDGETLPAVATNPAHGNQYLCHDFASWVYGDPIGKDWWEYHSGTTPKVYSQIKANECKQEDWEVLEGIPSTENLFVAAGGDLFSIDVAGTFEHQENITRTTTINVVINHVWTTDAPCTLSCPGHSIPHNSDPIESTGNPGTIGAAGADGPVKVCKCCGATVQGKGGTAGVAPTPPAFPGDPGDPGTPPGAGSVDSHSCSYTITYYCNAPNSFSGNFTSSNVCDSSVLTLEQRYVGTATGTCKCGASCTTPSVRTDLMDEGYTVSYGCVCSNNHNFEHATTEVKPYIFKEYINQIFYLNMTDFAVYGLSKVATTAVNGSILPNSSKKQSGLQETGLACWDLPSGSMSSSDVWAKYTSGNGRLYFTQYKNPTYTNGAGWYGSAPNVFYWLGDSTITLNIEADDPSGGFTADGRATIGVRHGGGKTDNHQQPTTCSITTWQGSKWCNGDLMTGQTLNNEAACVASQWLRQQDNTAEGGHAVVMSDALAVKAKDQAGWKSQDIVNAAYELTPTSTRGSTTTPAMGNDCWAIFDANTWCTASNIGQVIAECWYTSRVLTKYDLFYNPTQFNGRAIFTDSDIGRLGFYGSPGSAHEATDSYTEAVAGNKVQGEIDCATSLCTGANAIAANRSNNGMGWAEARVFTQGTDYGNIPEGSNYPYSSAANRYRCELESNGGGAGGASFEGFYDYYTYEGYGGGSLAQDKFGSPATGVITKIPQCEGIGGNAASGTNNTNANLATYGIPIAMHAAFDIKDWIPNGVYSSPVTTKAWFSTIGRKTEWASSPEWQTAKDRQDLDYVTDKGIQVGFSGTGSEINPVVIHDPVSAEGCYFISQDIYDPGDDDRVDALPDTQHRLKNDYLVSGNDFYIWWSDVAFLYDGAGGWGASGPNDKLGTGTGGALFPSRDYTSFSSLKSSYGYNGGDTGDGYMDRMYCTKWIYDRYVKFPFAVTFKGTDGVLKTAGADQWIALSGVLSCDAEFNDVSQTITTNNSSGGSNGPAAYKYPFTDAPDGGDGNLENMGWMFYFFGDTSMLESTGAQIQFGVVANNNVAKGNEMGDIQVKGTRAGVITNANVNNRNRSGGTAPASAIKKHTVELVGRIGNFTIEDSGDFRYSNLFKVAQDSWLIDGVVHNVYKDQPYHVVADKKDITNVVAGASTNGHATTSIMYQEATNSAGNRVKTGKADSDFVTLPLTPVDNNIEEFRSESMRMGYSLYCDIETWGNYYGINVNTVEDSGHTNSNTGSETDILNMSGSVHDESSFDDTSTYQRKYKTEINLRYFLLDLSKKVDPSNPFSNYIPIDIYYGEDGQRVPCFLWNKNTPIDWNQYVEMAVEAERRNTTKAEKDWSKTAIDNLNYVRFGRNLHESATAINPYDYSRDLIGQADSLVLDQKDRTFIGSSVMNMDLVPNPNGVNYTVRGNSTMAYSWNDMPLGKNTDRLGQQRENYAAISNFSPNLEHYTLSDANNFKWLNAICGLSEKEYAQQGQRWHFCIGLPSTAYIVPSVCGPALDGTDANKNYLKEITGKTTYNSQLIIEDAHEKLLKKYPDSTVVCLMEVTATGEVWKLKYDNKAEDDTFKVYDKTAKEKGDKPYADDEGYDYTPPRGFEDWTIVTTYDPEYTSYDDLTIYGTH